SMRPLGTRVFLASILTAACSETPLFTIDRAAEVVPPCAPARSAEPSPLRRSAAEGAVTLTFDELRGRINGRCQQCHLTTRVGGFQYEDTYPWLSENAQRMADQLLQGKMPPNDPNPTDSQLLGMTITAWLDAGKPMDSFRAPGSLGGSATVAGRL